MQQKPCTEIKRVLKEELIDAILPAAVGSCIIRCGPDFGWVVLESITVGLAALCLYSPFTEKFIYLPPNLPIIYSKFAMSHPMLESLVFLEGIFYCLFYSGQLVAFKVADESWKC